MNVGPGLLTEMSLHGDQPAGDSEWMPAGERAYGESGREYVYLKITNRIHTYPPTNPAVVTPPSPITSKPPIVWIGSPNFQAGRGGSKPLALVLHTMAGSLAGSDSWFQSPAAKVSAHFGVGLSGAIHGYVATQDTAWANGILETGNVWPGTAGVNPNRESLSIETEDLGNAQQQVSAEQYAAVLALSKWLLSIQPSLKFLVTHRAISPKSRPGCPGGRWKPWLPDLASDLGLTLVA